MMSKRRYTKQQALQLIMDSDTNYDNSGTESDENYNDSDYDVARELGLRHGYSVKLTGF